MIGAVCIASCFLFNIRGMRPAVWFSYVTGAMMIIPVLALAFIPLINGDITSHALNVSLIEPSVIFYNESTATSASTFSQTAMVDRLVLGDRLVDVRAGGSGHVRARVRRHPQRHAVGDRLDRRAQRRAVAAAAAHDRGRARRRLRSPQDTTFIAYLTEALDQTVGETLGGLFVVFVCGGLLLSMNTATMDGSRALYGMAREGLTFRQLDRLNAHSVPSRAMTVDMVLNLGLLFIAPTLLFTLVAGNIGYVLSHVFALSGFLLLRRDRPDWPRPLRHGPIWIVVCWICLAVNLIGTVFGVIWIHYTGYLYKATDSALGYDVKYYAPAAIITGLLVLVVGVVGYIVGQRQHGKKFSWKDLSEEEPSPEVYALMAAPGASAAPAAAGD